MTKRRGHWMQTYTGRAYWPLDPRADEVDIRDIAHALSLICRYGGHCNKFYSVAEHSVHVSRLVPSNDGLIGLLHDAPEAYCGDVVRPLKKSMPAYAPIEARNWAVLAECFGLADTLPQSVHDADVAMLFAEQKALLKAPPRRDWGMGLVTPVKADVALIECWSPERAELAFLARFHTLHDSNSQHTRRNVCKASHPVAISAT